METIELNGAAVYSLAEDGRPNNLLGGVWHPDLPDRFLHAQHEGGFTRPGNSLAEVERAYLKSQKRPDEHLAGHSLYGGFIFRHYGHFMAECTHRLWAYSRMPEAFDHVLFCPQTSNGDKALHGVDDLPSYVLAVFDYFDIPRNKIKLVSSPIIAEKLTVPSPASRYASDGGKSTIASGYLDFLSSRAERFLGTGKSGAPKIYVSRSNYLHRGGYAAENYLEKLLHEEGFMIMKPEQIPLQDQLAYFHSAEMIIFAEGSAVHTMELLGRDNRKTGVIHRRADTLPLMTSVLKPRSSSFHAFDCCTTLPALTARDKGNLGTARALSLLDGNKLANYLRRHFGLKLTNFDLNDFFRHEAADITRYLFNLPVLHRKNIGTFPQSFGEFKNELKKRENPWLQTEIPAIE